MMNRQAHDKLRIKRKTLGIRAGLLTGLAAAGLTLAQAYGETNAIEQVKKSQWDRSAAFGATVTSGNSDTLLFNANIEGTKKWKKNELRLGADGTYGENDGEKNNEQLKGFAQYNHLLGQDKRWFVYGRMQGLHDAIADVEARFTIGPGVGYYFIKDERANLSGEIGPAVVVEKTGTSDWDAYFTIRLAERFEYKLNDRTKIWQGAEFLPQVDRFENYIANAELGIETAITKQWGLRVVLQDTYDNEPSPGREENDLKLIAGVSFKF